MKAEDLVFNNCGHWDIVEEVSEHDPNALASKFLLAFFIEAVDLSDSPRLVVPPRKMNPLGVPDFECHEE